MELTIPLKVEIDENQLKKAIENYMEENPDIVEVVRCKDCIHSSYYGKICHYSVGRDVSPDHFCSYGERREE